MTLNLHTIKPKKGARKDRMRVGRGLAKKGTYSGRGAKGQRARSGGRSGLKLKGLRKVMLGIPKLRGFKSLEEPKAVVNVGELSAAFASGAKVTPKLLRDKGLVEEIGAGVKVLGDGELTIKITLEGCQVSAGAKTKIEKAGGKVIE